MSRSASDRPGREGQQGTDDIDQRTAAESLKRGRKPKGHQIARNWVHVQLGDSDTIFQHEAAAIIGKSTKSLQRWRKIGYGPPFRMKDRWPLYSRAAVLAWKAKHDYRRTPSDLLLRHAIASDSYRESPCNHLQDTASEMQSPSGHKEPPARVGSGTSVSAGE